MGGSGALTDSARGQTWLTFGTSFLTLAYRHRDSINIAFTPDTARARYVILNPRAGGNWWRWNGSALCR